MTPATTIVCDGCGCCMQGGALDREHEWLIYICPCCPRVRRVEASKADLEAAVRLPSNIVNLSDYRLAVGSK